MNPRSLSVAGAVGLVLLSGSARAEDKPDVTRAQALFAEGRRLMAAGDYTAACPKLAESQALDPQADTALDLGICYEKASELAFKAAHELARSPEAGVAATPSVRVPPADASGGDTQPAGHTQRLVGLAIGGAGVAGAVAGVVTALMARSEYNSATSECAQGVCANASALSAMDSARSLATLSTVAFVGGALGLGAGAIVYFTAPSSKAGSGRAVGVGPASQGAGLSFAGRF